MSGMELNKIMAAILLAGIIGMTSGFIADLLVHPEPLQQAAYSVGGGPAPTAPTAAPAEPAGPPIAALLASADPAAGQAATRACTSCHTFDRGGANRVGPNLWDVVGRARASAQGFNYSQSLRAAGGEWDYEALNAFLRAPRQAVPGTSMTFAGIRNDQERANLIAYLRTLSDNPRPLPEAGAAPAGGASGGQPAPATTGQAPASPDAASATAERPSSASEAAAQQ